MDHEKQQGQDEEGGDAAHDEAHAAGHGVKQAVAIWKRKPKDLVMLGKHEGMPHGGGGHGSINYDNYKKKDVKEEMRALK